MSTYRNLIEFESKRAAEEGLEESAIIRLILHFTKLESYELFAKQDEEAPHEIEVLFKEACNKYINQLIPVQHITGYETFYGYEFMVNDKVLIPRFETEELVENILYEFDSFFACDIDACDIGTGSGAIAITLAKEEEKIHLVATDISEEAVDMAKKNACALGADVEFLVGDMLNPLYGRKFDLLISNPPYIPEDEYVEPLVKEHEPNIALFGGLDGLFFYRIILENAHKILKPKAMMAFEHAYNTGDAIRKLILEYFPTARIKSLLDMAGRDRMIFVYLDSTCVKDGEVIIFPTDTVYGLGCKYLDKEGKKKIVEMKGRDPFKKIAVLCGSVEQIEEIAYVTDDARKLIDAFLPGGLTLILKGKVDETIGVRIPKSFYAQKILLDNGPMSTTSVNKSGDNPLNNKEEIIAEFGSLVDHMYFLEDDNFSGVSSTVVDLTDGVSILREGQITLEDIKKVLEK